MTEIPNKQIESFPFETATETEIAWLAGLLQAEANFYLDSRIRSKSKDQNYIPPPPSPGIKLDMIEEDLMNYIGKLVGQNVTKLKRATSANNFVYRINISSRSKVERLLKIILPYIIGEKNRTKILYHLDICEKYNNWLNAGGRKNAASLAARASATVKEEKKKDREKISGE